MSKLATKTKSQTNKKRLFYYWILSIGAIMIFIAPLLHIEFPKVNPRIEDYRNQLSSSITALDMRIFSLKSRYNNGTAKGKEYFKQLGILITEKEIQQSENDVLIKEKIDNARVFGWRNTRIFLVGFGIRLPYLLFSLIISLLIARIRTKDEHLLRTFFFLQVSCYSIAVYELVWVFWNFQDFPLETYRVAIIFMCSVVGFLCAFSFKYYESNEFKIIKLKSSFLNFIVEIRNDHYKPMLKKAMIQGLYDELYQEEIKLETKKFEERLRDKAEELN